MAPSSSFTTSVSFLGNAVDADEGKVPGSGRRDGPPKHPNRLLFLKGKDRVWCAAPGLPTWELKEQTYGRLLFLFQVLIKLHNLSCIHPFSSALYLLLLIHEDFNYKLKMENENTYK